MRTRISREPYSFDMVILLSDLRNYFEGIILRMIVNNYLFPVDHFLLHYFVNALMKKR